MNFHYFAVYFHASVGQSKGSLRGRGAQGERPDFIPMPASHGSNQFISFSVNIRRQSNSRQAGRVGLIESC